MLSRIESFKDCPEVQLCKYAKAHFHCAALQMLLCERKHDPACPSVTSIAIVHYRLVIAGEALRGGAATKRKPKKDLLALVTPAWPPDTIPRQNQIDMPMVAEQQALHVPILAQSTLHYDCGASAGCRCTEHATKRYFQKERARNCRLEAATKLRLNSPADSMLVYCRRYGQNWPSKQLNQSRITCAACIEQAL